MAKRAELLVLLGLVFLPACVTVRLPFEPSEKTKEVTVAGKGTEKILMVDVSGVLSFQKPWAPPGWPREESLPARLRADLDRARKDRHIRALLVRIDSPGGTVTASDVIFHEIRLFRREKNVPVVAAIVGNGLSGGYYAAVAADEIVANPTAIVGSVGVFVPKFDVSPLLERWGIRSEITKSGPQKDILSPLRPLDPAERDTVRNIVEELNGRFQDTVRAARTQATEADLQAMATAAPFGARKALELHMVDRIGYIEDAFRAALDLAGLTEGRLVAYRAPGAGPANPYSLAFLPQGVGPGLLFLDPRWISDLLQGGAYY